MEEAYKKSQLRQHITFGWRHQLRWMYQKTRLGYCGKRVYIEKNVQLMRYPGNIHIMERVLIKEGARICACNKHAKINIGRNTTIGYHNFIFASDGIEIGEDCLIAPFVYIVDSNHQIDRNIRINQQSNLTAPIKIGSDVWIASGCTILKGVTIGEGAVIGAHSLVNKDVEPYTIVAGTPAVKIGDRN